MKVPEFLPSCSDGSGSLTPCQSLAARVSKRRRAQNPLVARDRHE
jgi:hypothetical protein